MPRAAKNQKELLPRGIRRHKSGGYIVDVTFNGERRTQTAPTLEQAIIVQNNLRAQLVQAVQVLTSWTLKTAVGKTIDLVWAGRGGEMSSRRNAKAALDFFGEDCPLPHITTDRIDEYVQFLLKKGNSGATINRKLAALSRCLRTALERDKLAAIPHMPRRPEGEHRIRFLTEDEEEKMLSIIERLGYAPLLKDVILVMIYTGFRCGEVWNMQAKDINPETGTITAWKTKSGHPRTIPIVDKIQPIIERLLGSSGGGRLFPGCNNTWLRPRWERVRFHMGMADDAQFVPHMLRHTCATRLSREGVSMPLIKEWMGHSTIQVTARYAHFAPSDLYKAAKALSKNAT
ncbi:hypothetical protein HMPREF1022_03307 [Desulfovibrio sp. 6_1_46AFAA]|uniref:tyrosine-type recombinase/integrase n=1 Tax=Desulfovibrio sp. 6_1_46AFAA TaxID=665942 RepID=UPI00022373C5|nr:site-specific integrase [Desulfovibrio sp. 6_1_46AFAA]EGW49678.1 hypothetical protein HMPREF1022_03307 [Desulfovibrio sp. 6_1_46AFAA]